MPSGVGLTGMLMGLEAGAGIAAFEGAPVPVARPQTRDAYVEREGTAPREKASRTAAESKDQSNPFSRELPAGAQRGDLRRLAKSVDLRIGVEFAGSTALALAAAEMATGANKTFGKVRHGNMLLLSDGQRGLAGLKGQAQLQSTASAIAQGKGDAANSAFKSYALLNARFLAGGRVNVQALVQQVMREAYLIQNEILEDRAKRLKFMNDQKKRVRERAKLANELKAQWVSMSMGEKNWVSDTPLEYMELDDNGDWNQAVNSESDVEAWKAQEAAKVTGQQSAVGGAQNLWGPSQLTDRDRVYLKSMVKKKSGNLFNSKNDDYIRETIDELIALLPKMNENELRTYLLPALEMLTFGNMDEEEVLAIVGALTPAQRIWLKANEREHSDPLYEALHNYNEVEQLQMDLSMLDAAQAVAANLGTEYVGTGVSADQAEELLAQLAAQDARQKNPELAAEGAAQNDGAGGVPVVGGPKTIRSYGELEAYVTSLDGKLNSIGEDAQLANTDLQNALQIQQQMLQMMSNISKMLHDTALSVIRKIGG